MNSSGFLLRTIYALLSVFFFTVLCANILPYGYTTATLGIGAGAGLLFSFLLFSSDFFLRKASLKSLNCISLGLFFGYLLGQSTNLVLTGVFEMAALSTPPETLALIKAGVFLCSVYFGITFVVRASEDFYISVPFVKFKQSSEKKKDVVLDVSVLSDPRLIDLAASGIVDNVLLLPQLVQKELYETAESLNEGLRYKAKRALEVIKKLEEMPGLNLRKVETNFPELKDTQSKLVRIARLMDANILTSEMNQIEQSTVEGVRIININSLSKALKPLTQTGEFIQIKVQRYGKEARQGVGYLDDGTMVVINGGAEFIGETIKAQVLSVKHTSSGRMIFCNAQEEEFSQVPLQDMVGITEDQAAKKYFAL